MYVLINREREKRGLAPLAMNEALEASATAKAVDMVERGYFSHVDPDGKDPTGLVQVPSTLFEECIFRGYARSWTPVNWWFNSPDHVKAMVSTEVTDMGIGWAYGDWGHRKSVPFVVLHLIKV